MTDVVVRVHDHESSPGIGAHVTDAHVTETSTAQSTTATVVNTVELQRNFFERRRRAMAMSKSLDGK